jgi:tetraacyldisaccharide 4'-kinase
MAPRHIERAEDVVKTVRQRGFKPIRRTELSQRTDSGESLPQGPRVLILDTRGELASLYREAALVFVGGSLVPVSGHNLLEPAAWGKAVVFGPHIDHVAEVADLLVSQGGGLQIHDAQDMAETMIGLLKDRDRLEQMGKAAYELVLANQGAVARNLDLIAKVLSGKGYGIEREPSVENRSWTGVALSPLVPLSHAYGLAMRLRGVLYARGLLARRSLPCRAISVGNLTVGGTGKTPVVIAMANAFAERGHRVGVASRGYRRRSVATLLEVSDGRSIQGTPDETGDEPVLIAERCPGVPVAVGADRHQVGRYLVDRFDIGTLILDDGFQHLGLHRDLDVLILDATAPFGNGYLLPRGRLREPLSAMARASAVLITRACQAERLDDLKAAVRAVHSAVPIWVTDFAPSALIHVSGKEMLDSATLKGARVLAVSGIGNPESFRRLLLATGATVVDRCVFPDHHAYSQEDVQRVQRAAERAGADRIVTTEKDAVKLARLVLSPSPFEGEGRVRGDIWVVRIDLQWLEGREEWERMVLQG